MSVRKIFLWGVLPLIVGLVAACAISEPAFQKARQRGWTTYTADNSGLVNDSVHAIAFDEQGRAWIGTYSGVNAFSGEFWANYGPNYVCAIAFDEQGRVWTGAESTVSVFDGETWTNYTADDPGLTGGSIGAIALDDQGRVWIGVNYYRPYEYYHHSVKAFDGEIWITYSADDSGLADGFINIIAFDKQGCAWVGTEHGVSVFDWETWTTYAVGDVKAIAFDEQGRAWIGTEHGISVFDGGAWTAYTADNSGLVDSAVRAIAFDERGRAWVGTERGVSVLDRGSWIIYTAENSGLKDVWDVHAIVFDKEGRAWIGSTLGGISVLSPDEVTPVPQPLVELEKYWICLLCFSPIVFAVLITIWLIARPARGRPKVVEEQVRVGWGFWLWWTLADTVRFIVSYLVTLEAFLLLFRSSNALAFIGPGIAGGAVGGVVSGFMQWLALRRHISRAGLWTSIGAVCFAAGYAVTVQVAALLFFIGVLAGGGTTGPALLEKGIVGRDMLGVAMFGMSVGIVSGVASGLAQWLILRQYVSRSGWWIPACSVGLIINSIVSWVGTPIAIAIGLAPADPDYAPVLTDLTSLIVVRCLEIVAGVVVGGAITGGVLTWVLRHPREGAVDQGTSEQDLDNLEDEPATAITGGYSAGG